MTLYLVQSTVTILLALNARGSMALPPNHLVSGLSPNHQPSSIQEVVSQPRAKKTLTLHNRHQTASTNEVFKKNILLNLAYMRGIVTDSDSIDWDQVHEPFQYSFVLLPGESFAYHDHVLDAYASTTTTTTNAHFDASEGFLFSGYLYGDGVCHLASVINWAAQDAQLHTHVPRKHGIAPIPDVPAEYGVSIYTDQTQPGSGTGNNLYITNDQTYPVRFSLEYDGQDHLSVAIDDVTQTLVTLHEN